LRMSLQRMLRKSGLDPEKSQSLSGHSQLE
jgi:hypothetical protein